MKPKHLIFTLLALLTSITSSAYDFSQSGLCYNITSTSAKTVAVAGRTANPDDYLSILDIPSQVTYNGVTYNVTSIANRAFIGHEIYDVTLPEGIISIGEAAFYQVPIYEVKIPASVQEIGEGAFGGCWDNCPDGEDYCWVYYPGKYTVDSNNQTYASTSGILYNKERTKLIDVPCGLSQNIYIPTTLEEMPSDAFNNCGYLSEKNLYISDLTKFCQINVVGPSGNSIYGSVFSRVNKVYNYETFYWSDGGSHQEYVEITSTLTIPKDVKTIGRGIFSGWKTLSNVIFPSMGVTQIGDYAFAATKITQVTLPASIQTIGQNAFYQQWEEYVYDEDGDWSDTNIWTMAMSSLTIPQNVQSIGSNAFNLTNGAIVTSKNNTPNNISSYAFKNASNCTLAVGQGLQSTYSQKTGWNAFGTIEEDEDIIPYIDGEVFTATTPDGLKMTFKVLSASEKTVQVGDGENAAIDQSYEGDVIIPTQINGLTIKKIGNYAFKECKHLYFVDIPENVLLGDGAFSRANLKKIIVKTAISSATFWCANIGELIIESSVSYGGYQAFFQNKIDRLMIKPSETALTYSNGKNSYPMFEDCNIGTAIIERRMYSAYYGSHTMKPFMYSTIDSLYVRSNFSCESSASINNTIGDIFFEGLTNIDSYNYRTSISRIHFSEGLSSISSNAFISSFENSIILPSSLTSIGDNAISISSAPSVTSLATTPPSITETSFGSNATYNIPLYVPQGCREQYASATGWNKFTNIIELGDYGNIISFADSEAKKMCIRYYDVDGDDEISEGEAMLVTSIREYVLFQSSIKSFIELGSYFTNLLSIGNHAFDSCSSLTSITLPASVTSIGDGAFQYCSGLTSISIPASVTDIGYGAFQSCSGLTSITIPDAVTSIGTNAFYGCSNLTSVKVDITTPLSIVSGTFSNRANATLYVPAGSKAAYESADYWKEFKRIIEFIEGDVNGDGEMDVVDVVDIARYVVGTPAETFVPILADITSDGNVNIGDAVALVNEIAGDQDFVKGMRAPQRVSEGEETLTLKGADNNLSLVLQNTHKYTAFQFDLYVPDGVDVASMLLNAQRKQKHQLLYNKVEDGHWRVAALSTSNRSFDGNDGELLAINLEGITSDDINIRNIHFFTADGGDYEFDDLKMQSGIVTDIDSPNMSPATVGNGSIYTLDGRSVSGKPQQKGIYIVNGKKIVKR